MPNGPPNFTPPQTPTSSLVALWQSMQTYFTNNAINAKVYLGLKYRDLLDTSRVVIIDGEFDGSGTPRPRNAGSFGAPWQKQSVNPRELVSWERPVTLSIRGVDASNPDAEDMQTAATETLIEASVQALVQAMAVNPSTGAAVSIGQNNVDFKNSKAIWVDPGTATQQTWGKEMLLTFLYKCIFFDLPDSIAYPTPNLEKGPLLSTLRSGVNAQILQAGPSAATARIGNLGFCDPSIAGGGFSLKLTGAFSAGNNGTFPIVALASRTSLVITNANAVAPDANNGSIAWAIVPTP